MNWSEWWYQANTWPGIGWVHPLANVAIGLFAAICLVGICLLVFGGWWRDR